MQPATTPPTPRDLLHAGPATLVGLTHRTPAAPALAEHLCLGCVNATTPLCAYEQLWMTPAVLTRQRTAGFRTPDITFPRRVPGQFGFTPRQALKRLRATPVRGAQVGFYHTAA